MLIRSLNYFEKNVVFYINAETTFWHVNKTVIYKLILNNIMYKIIGQRYNSIFVQLLFALFVVGLKFFCTYIQTATAQASSRNGCGVTRGSSTGCFRGTDVSLTIGMTKRIVFLSRSRASTSSQLFVLLNELFQQSNDSFFPAT